jgi:hypothetical protein
LRGYFKKEKNVGKEKNTYLCAMEEMIHIRRSEYEELIELVRELRAEIESLKNGRNSKTSSTAPSHDINRSNAHSLRKSRGKPSVIDTTLKNKQDVFFALKCLANIQITNST